jgi:hypothetical protein
MQQPASSYQRDYGGKKTFSGQAATIKCYENNPLVRKVRGKSIKNNKPNNKAKSSRHNSMHVQEVQGAACRTADDNGQILPHHPVTAHISRPAAPPVRRS